MPFGPQGNKLSLNPKESVHVGSFAAQDKQPLSARSMEARLLTVISIDRIEDVAQLSVRSPGAECTWQRPCTQPKLVAPSEKTALRANLDRGRTFHIVSQQARAERRCRTPQAELSGWQTSRRPAISRHSLFSSLHASDLAPRGPGPHRTVTAASAARGL
jgi:hypothetical protein